MTSLTNEKGIWSMTSHTDEIGAWLMTCPWNSHTDGHGCSTVKYNDQ